MFSTSIGPSSNLPGYLRPETAQGQFLTFAKLLEFNNLRMPFASASIGKSFRNEISPRSGLLRVREFLMAEIEHYVDPSEKKHPRFKEVADTVTLKFLPREIQEQGRTTTVEKTIGEAVKEGMVDNETLGYFLARINLFLDELGVDQTKVRFRQHMPNEMAHYAADCWDAELLTSYGWIECVGCADRSAYDLTVHMQKTGQPLLVRENLEVPRVWEEWDIDVDKKWLGPRFRGDAKKVEKAVSNISQEEREKLAGLLKKGEKVMIKIGGLGVVELEKVVIEKRSKTQNGNNSSSVLEDIVTRDETDMIHDLQYGNTPPTSSSPPSGSAAYCIPSSNTSTGHAPTPLNAASSLFPPVSRPPKSSSCPSLPTLNSRP